VNDQPGAYASAGVSIEAGNRAVSLMRDAVRATYGPEVLAGIGAFGGLFDAAALRAMDHPVLVASTDGVGTKVKLAAQLNRFDTIGEDLVNHCINDILVQGARPLFFLDYVAAAKLDPEMIAAVVSGLARACRAVGCALLGGETAEMPGVYQAGEFDVAGTIVGMVERQGIFPRSGLVAGDMLIGLPSSGPHTNGYSLIRKIVADLDLDQPLSGTTTSLADALLAPHRQYLTIVGPLLAQPTTPVKALAHLTGGGFIDNLPRVMPEGLGVDIDPQGWPVPPVFTFLQAQGAVDPVEMYRVFNMGIGLVLIVAADRVAEAQAALPIDSYCIGCVTDRHPGVHIT
jgi:phosphoribosylformylglycinamidine cyclo-ligase/phosphoribosylamine--glycine ligase/phosphoribosylformylglycinamidine cyclo-ligase